MKDAIIRVIDVENEPLCMTALEQPIEETCKHCGRGSSHKFRPTNFPNLLEDIAAAWARRARKGAP